MRLRFILPAAISATVASLAPSQACAQTIVLDPIVITATRGPGAVSEIPSSVRVMDAEELARTPALTLDGALRSVPGFSLFRRSDSLSAHPTSQGVSLRGLGPSGASRTLVLLDGVPVNDPFGGWVSWSKLPRLSLDRIEVVRGGGATAWGNAALGGVVQLISAPPQSGTARLQVAGGSHSHGSAEFVAAQHTRFGVVEIAGRALSTDGFEVVAPENRGAVDIPASQRHRWLSARLLAKAGADTDLIATARVFRENRGNGTPLQINRTRDALASIVINHRPPAGVRWTATAFVQDQKFSSIFSSVNATRTAETPASDQFSVPSEAWGFAWAATIDSGRGGTTAAGFDFRSVRGETNEDSSFSNGTFTRRRVAGGVQQIGGVFALHSIDFSDSVRLVGGLRADRWTDTDGFRRESLIESGVVTRDDDYASRDDWEMSPSVGIVWSATARLRLRASAQRAFRRPTLNEFYRPFRVGAFITESNPGLSTETVETVEAGVEWSRRPLAISATIFRHDLRDAVANVTVVHGPGMFPDFGFIPAGGAGRKRLNLDRVVVRGAELSAKLSLGDSATLVVEYLRSDARVRSGDPDPSLKGKALAQVPRHSATLSLEWRGPAGLTVAPRVRAFSRQFEDDENLLSLAGGVVGDVLVSVPVGASTELFLVAENVGDSRIETGRSSTGVVNTGTPRTIAIGVRTDF